jgi:hypothetical protein
MKFIDSLTARDFPDMTRVGIAGARCQSLMGAVHMNEQHRVPRQ